MPVSHETVAPVRQPGIPHRGKKRLRLRFHRLGQQSSRTVPENRRQWIIDSVGLTQGNNGAIHRHGVSAPSGVQAGFHPPRYAASFTSPSPNFPHSSRRASSWRPGKRDLRRARQGADALGERLEFVAEAGPGDFIYVPPYVPHQEINAAGSEPLECMLGAQ